jgi:hypothetical protein
MNDSFLFLPTGTDNNLLQLKLSGQRESIFKNGLGSTILLYGDAQMIIGKKQKS